MNLDHRTDLELACYGFLVSFLAVYTLIFFIDSLMEVLS